MSEPNAPSPPLLSAPAKQLRKICDVLKSRSGLARAELLLGAKSVYLAAFPASKKGGAPGKKGGGKAKSATVAGFVPYMAVESGLSEKTISDDVKLAKSLDEEVREKIRNTPIANRPKELKALGRLKGVKLQMDGLGMLQDERYEDFAALVPRPLLERSASTSPEVTVDLALGVPTEVVVGQRSLLLTLSSLEGGAAHVLVCPARPGSRVATTTTATQPNALQPVEVQDQEQSGHAEDEQPEPLSTGVENDRLLASWHPSTWGNIIAAECRGLTPEDLETFAFKALDKGDPLQRVVLPEHLEAREAYGPLFKFATKAVNRPERDLKRSAEEAGLTPIAKGHPEPFATVVALFGKTNAGVRLVGIGTCAESGDVPEAVYVVRGDKLYKVNTYGSVLGAPLHTWVTRGNAEPAAE